MTKFKLLTVALASLTLSTSVLAGPNQGFGGGRGGGDLDNGGGNRSDGGSAMVLPWESPSVQSVYDYESEYSTEKENVEPTSVDSDFGEVDLDNDMDPVMRQSTGTEEGAHSLGVAGDTSNLGQGAANYGIVHQNQPGLGNTRAGMRDK